MLAATLVETTGIDKSPVGHVVAFLGTPLIALLITTVVAIFVFRRLLDVAGVSTSSNFENARHPKPD